MNIHIGQIIKEHFEASGLTLSAFAEKTYLQRQNVKKSVFDKSSIDTDILMRISKVLKYNFFQHYLKSLPETSENYSILSEPNEIYSKTTKPKFTVSIEIDDPEMKDTILRMLKGD